MDREKFNGNLIIPIIFSLLYTIYFYLVTKFYIESGILISINNITIDNIGTKFICDFFIMLLVPLVLMVINKKRINNFKLQFKHKYLQYFLISTMVVLFLLHGDFTIKGFYKVFFYLFVVGFGEEFIFRGYVYNELLQHNKLLAIIISGFFWGILHAILPGLLNGSGLGQIGVSMLSEIGKGIFMGYYFIYLMEKSESLFIPVFVHSILNYTVGVIGIVIAIGTGIYLYKKDKNIMKKSTKNRNHF